MSNMIGIKNSIAEGPSCPQVKTGRGSLACEGLHWDIGQIFPNVSQYKPVKNLGISLSTAHYIIKRIREGEIIFECRGQGQGPGQKPILDHCDLQSVLLCLQNTNQMNFHHPFCLNFVRCPSFYTSFMFSYS